MVHDILPRLHECVGAPQTITRALIAVESHRPPMINEGTETAFRHGHCKHKKKGNKSGGQRSVDAITGLHLYRPQKKHSPRSEFTAEVHRWFSKLNARHLQILHQEIF